MDHDLSDRYVLTELGIRLLAARAGVPLDTYARHGGVTAARQSRSDSPTRRIRHRAHTIGVNRFFAQLAADAREAGWRLEEWRNEAESTRRFVNSDGRTSWIRPDGSGVLARGEKSRPFLLEYDRGTLDGGDYRNKFQAYRLYFAGRGWHDDFASEPELLFVCEDERAEQRVVRAGVAYAPDVSLFVTGRWRYESDVRNSAGLLGAIWRSPTTTDLRCRLWPLFDRTSTTQLNSQGGRRLDG